jgi:serine phosphatase RsbU (regulator of sigma subunit)
MMANVRGLSTPANGYARYLRHVVRTLADLHSPGSLLECLNLVFHRRVADDGTNCFAGLFLAALQGGHLTYASGGHDLALLLHATGRYSRLRLGGKMLGIAAGQRFKERSVAVVPGDWLVLATDAIAEVRDARGVRFGSSGIARNTFAAIKAGSEDPAARVFEAARQHGLCRTPPGASVLCVRVSPSGRDVHAGE